MNQKVRNLVAAIILSSTLAACSGSANVNVANPFPALQSYFAELRAGGSAKEAVTSTATVSAAQQQSAATDLVPYRSQYDATLKAWIVYYYSPSQKKSYECRPQPDKSVKVVEVTDVNVVYQEGETLEVNKVTVDAATAAEKAATTTTNTTTTNTTNTTTNNVTITNVTLISAGEARKKHNRKTDNPVYVVVTNNQPVYIDASTGSTVTATVGADVGVGGDGATVGGVVTTSPAPTASPSPAPAASATPSPAPSASASPAS